MYLIKRIQEVYEISSYLSTEFVIAEYLLTHIDDIQNLSLKDICNATSISKSVVSKFFKKITFDQNFSLFRSAMILEQEYNVIDDKKLINDALILKEKFMQQDLNNYQWLNNDKLKSLAKYFWKADKIIFYGNLSKRSYFQYLIYSLLKDGKKARFVSYSYYNFNNNELMDLKENDLFVVVEPDNTFYEYSLKTLASVDAPFSFSNIKSHIMFIGSGIKEERHIINVGIEKTKNLFMDDILLQLFCHQVLYYYKKI